MPVCGDRAAQPGEPSYRIHLRFTRVVDTPPRLPSGCLLEGLLIICQAGLPRRGAKSSTGRCHKPPRLLAELGVVGLVVLVAGLIRVPYLWDLPRLTDESKEAFRALLILQQGLRPLTNVDMYIGPIWNYLLAAV